MQWRRNEFESGGGDVGPAQNWGRAPKYFLLVVPFHFFGSKSTIMYSLIKSHVSNRTMHNKIQYDIKVNMAIKTALIFN